MVNLPDPREVFRRSIEPAAVYNFYLRCPNETHSKEGKNTRNEILKWISKPRSDSSAQIAWLIGSTDDERSSIAYSVARASDDDKRLAASCFEPVHCAQEMRPVDQWFVATLGYQISRLEGFEWFTERVQDAIEVDMDIFNKSLVTQFDRLLLEPLRLRQADIGRKISTRSMLIVIDLPLSENGTPCSVANLENMYSAVAHAAADPAFPFLILFTSPPGNFITSDAKEIKAFRLGKTHLEAQCSCWRKGSIGLKDIERLSKLPNITLGVTLSQTIIILDTFMHSVQAPSVHPKLASVAQHLLFVLDALEAQTETAMMIPLIAECLVVNFLAIRILSKSSRHWSQSPLSVEEAITTLCDAARDLRKQYPVPDVDTLRERFRDSWAKLDIGLKFGLGTDREELSKEIMQMFWSALEDDSCLWGIEIERQHGYHYCFGPNAYGYGCHVLAHEDLSLQYKRLQQEFVNGYGGDEPTSPPATYTCEPVSHSATSDGHCHEDAPPSTVDARVTCVRSLPIGLPNEPLDQDYSPAMEFDDWMLRGHNGLLLLLCVVSALKIFTLHCIDRSEHHTHLSIWPLDFFRMKGSSNSSSEPQLPLNTQFDDWRLKSNYDRTEHSTPVSPPRRTPNNPSDQPRSPLLNTQVDDGGVREDYGTVTVNPPSKSMTLTLHRTDRTEHPASVSPSTRVRGSPSDWSHSPIKTQFDDWGMGVNYARPAVSSSPNSMTSTFHDTDRAESPPSASPPTRVPSGLSDRSYSPVNAQFDDWGMGLNHGRPAMDPIEVNDLHPLPHRQR